MMMRFSVARRSQVEGGRKRAAVCSFPPSWVGAGIKDSVPSSGFEEEVPRVGEWERGRR